MVLGRHGGLTADQAREAARAELAKVTLGKSDPAAERAAARREKTAAEFLRHVLETHWRAKKKASTAKNFEGMIERTLISCVRDKKAFSSQASRREDLVCKAECIACSRRIPRRRDPSQGDGHRACRRPDHGESLNGGSRPIRSVSATAFQVMTRCVRYSTLSIRSHLGPKWRFCSTCSVSRARALASGGQQSGPGFRPMVRRSICPMRRLEPVRWHCRASLERFFPRPADPRRQVHYSER